MNKPPDSRITYYMARALARRFPAAPPRKVALVVSGASLYLLPYLLPVLLLTGLLMSANASSAASDVGSTTEQPSDLPDWITANLAEEGITVTNSLGSELVFWLRAELPKGEPRGDFGVDFPNFPPGAFLGLLEVKSEWSDYKTQKVAPGRYTLRYGIQPADGDHTGQTYFRDFIMILPVDGDTFPIDGQDDPEPLVEAALAVSGSEHPAVFALYQIYDEVEAISVVANDYGEPCLAIPTDEMTMGIVIEGHGQELTL